MPGGLIRREETSLEFSLQSMNDEVPRLTALFSKFLPDSFGFSELKQLSDTLIKVWNAFSTCRDSSFTLDRKTTFDLISLSRVLSVLNVLESCPYPKPYLKRLLKGSIHFLHEGRTPAKDTLWELEVGRRCQRIGSPITLGSPDISLICEGEELAIECKKIYGESHIQAIFSKAVRQFASFQGMRVVAINLDEILESREMVQSSSTAAADFLNRRNLEFFGRHQRHFLRYFQSDRIVGVLANSTCLFAIQNNCEAPRPSLVNIWTIWSHPDSSHQKRGKLEKLASPLLSETSKSLV